MSGPSDRVLYLDDEDRLGEAVDADCFRCNWQWWLDLTVMSPDLDEESVIGEEVALALADSIDLENYQWLLHLHDWHDADQTITTAFIAFLRGGGFSVIDLTEILPHEYAVEDNEEEG